MDIESFVAYFLAYLSDWKPWVLVIMTIMLNFWVLDAIKPKTIEARKWTVRISSILICLALGFILFEQTRIAVISEIFIGIATPFLFKSAHALLLAFRPGIVDAYDKVTPNDDDPKT